MQTSSYRHKKKDQMNCTLYLLPSPLSDLHALPQVYCHEINSRCEFQLLSQTIYQFMPVTTKVSLQMVFLMLFTAWLLWRVRINQRSSHNPSLPQTVPEIPSILAHPARTMIQNPTRLSCQVLVSVFWLF